jgi:ABC-type multidrug transport system fused ATPase/permease subunit
METLRFIFRHLGQFKVRFGVVFFSGILDGIAIFLIPVLLSEFTKTTLDRGRFQSLVIYIVAIYAASLFFQWIIRAYGESLSQQFGNHIRQWYFGMVEKLSLGDLVKHHSGYTLSMINKVADGLDPIIHNIFWTFARGISTIVLFFYFTAKESVFIAAINLVVLTLFISLSVLLSKKMVPIAQKLNQMKSSLLASYVDFMSNIVTIKKLHVSSFVEKKLHDKTVENYRQIEKIQQFHANRWFLLHVLFGIAFLSTIGFILSKVWAGTITPSVLILFIAAYAIVRTNIEQLSENFKSLMEMRAYIEGVEHVIKSVKYPSGELVVKDWQTITFKDVLFQYPGNDKTISIPYFSVRRGEIISIMGTSGEGKSTFLNLFMNFLASTGGTRSVDLVPFESITPEFFGANMVAVSQETELFNMTLRENITLGKDVSDANLHEILEQLDLGQWVKSLDHGLDTVVGEKGVKMSAGQRQRVNLIRGLVFGREIVILDEPTSHLDEATEKRVLAYLKKELINKTVIVVSHRDVFREMSNKCYSMKNKILSEII